MLPDERPVWRLCLFGSVRLVDPEGQRSSVVRFRTQKCAALLAYLALSPGGPHVRERIAEALWPDADPAVARDRLKQELATLRRHTETAAGLPHGSVIEALGRTHLRLRPGAVLSEADAYEADLRAATRAEANGEYILAREALQRAVTAYTAGGSLLPGVYEDWLVPFQERFTRLQQSALAQLARIERRLLNSAEGEAPPVGITKIDIPPVFAAADPLTSELHPALLAEPALPRTLNRFFGRDTELEELIALIVREPAARLITLTGPGGAGKTRLALEAVRTLREKAGGQGAVRIAGWVELGAVEDVQHIPAAILTSLPYVPGAGLDTASDTEGAGPILWRIATALAPGMLDAEGRAAYSGRSLLVLDNLEHLAEQGASLVRVLLDMVPHLICLVTSRQHLQLEGEKEFRVDPLPVPWLVEQEAEARMDREKRPGESDTLLALLQNCPSVQLFTDRARAVRPDFVLTPRNIASVAVLCRTLEGMPLAIEMAAARIGVLGLAQMHEVLRASRLDLLVSSRRDLPERQRTLRGAVAWSFELLPVRARHLFLCLSVFRGGWTLEAAHEVSGLPLVEVVELLDTLRAHSFITVASEETTDHLRFGMLETLREFAAEKLALADTEGRMRRERERRHAAFFLRHAQETEAALALGEQAAGALHRLHQERENLRTVLSHALENGASADERLIAMQTAAALVEYWHLSGQHREGLDWLRRLLECEMSEGDEATAFRAKLLRGAGSLARSCGEYPLACRFFDEAILLARQSVGEKTDAGLASGLRGRGIVARFQGEQDHARSLFEEALTLRQAESDTAGVADALLNLGLLAAESGQFERALSLLEQSRVLFLEREDAIMAATAGHGMMFVALWQGDCAGARALLEQQEEEWGHCPIPWGRGCTALARGYLALLSGEGETARVALGESISIFRDAEIAVYLVWGLETLARGLLEWGDAARALELLAAADRWRVASGVPPFQVEQAAREQARQRAGALLDRETARRAREYGAKLSLRAAADRALG